MHLKTQIIIFTLLVLACQCGASKHARTLFYLSPTETGYNLHRNDKNNVLTIPDDIKGTIRKEEKFKRRSSVDTGDRLMKNKAWQQINEKRRMLLNTNRMKQVLRIRGGENATKSDYPYMAAILVNGQLWCAGVIVHKSFVLTAAHCLSYVVLVAPPEYTYESIRVRVGSNDALVGGVERNVTNVIRHPDYEQEPPPHADVAMLRLEKDLNYTKHIKPIWLYRGTKEPYAQTFVRVSGFGASTGNNSLEFKKKSTHLTSVRLKITRMEYCNDAYDMFEQLRITEDFFCASLRKGAIRDVCLFDAGAPAVQDGLLVGIMSFGPENCGVDDGPAVFIRSYYFRDFVNALIRERQIELEVKEMAELAELGKDDPESREDEAESSASITTEKSNKPTALP